MTPYIVGKPEYEIQGILVLPHNLIPFFFKNEKG